MKRCNKEESEQKHCEKCNVSMPVKEWLYHLRTWMHRRNVAVDSEHGLKCVKSIFSERIETYICENDREELQIPKEFLQDVKNRIMELLKVLLEKHTCFKYNLELFAEYIKTCKNSEQHDDEYGLDFDISMKSFNSKMHIINQINQLPTTYEKMSDIICKKCDEFQERDSGWSLIRILHLEININQYKPIRCSQYVTLPADISKKKACINVRNNDEYCFKWSIISALFKGSNKNSHLTTTYRILNISSSTIYLNGNFNHSILEFGSLEFPLKVADIEEFEILNESISINVFGLEEVSTKTGTFNQVIGPYYNTRQEKGNFKNFFFHCT